MPNDTIVQELPIKGALNSSTINSVLMMLGSFVVGKGVEILGAHSTEIQQVVVNHLPDWAMAPAAHLIDGVIGLLLAFFGSRAIKGRAAVGDIQGLYTKQP